MMKWACGFSVGFIVGGVVIWLIFRRRDRLRAQFLSFIAHEFNTPVSALNMTILNFLEGLFGDIPEEQRPWLILVREQIARLGALVGDFRDLVHEEFHKDLSLTIESVRLAPVVNNCLETMREAMVRSEASVEVEVSESLPMMKADPDRISRIVTSMLTHARKFRAKGPIGVSAKSAGGRQTFTVEYAGSPAERKHLDIALDLFFPARMADSQVLQSTGLGLGLPYRLVKAHGGDMRLVADGDRMRLEIEMPEARV